MPDLSSLVAVVTGATRGAGRGIAQELGAAGATVYVTGRSSRATPSADGYPGTIEDAAEAVTAEGGRGIAVAVDHGDEAAVAALFARVQAEAGRLDLLVNNAWGGHDGDGSFTPRPFWELPLATWERTMTRGARLGLIASTHAAPMMAARGRGLIVCTSFADRDRYTGHLYYDMAKYAINRLAFDMAQDLKAHGVASVALSPGWMRTELVLRAFDTDEARWHAVPALATTETPRYVGRAVVALAADPAVMGRTGRALVTGELAEEYGFTDVDGRRVPPFRMPD